MPNKLVNMGWVEAGMVEVLTLAPRHLPLIGVWRCLRATAAYAVAAGMWAVLWTDFFQFILMMTAVIILAIYAVDAAGGMAAVKAHAITHFGSESAALSVMPVRFTDGGIEAYAWMPIMTMLVFIAM